MSLLQAIFEQKVSKISFASEVVTCSRTTTLEAAVGMMSERGIGSIVIVDGEKPIGIFTERDVLRKVAGKPLDLKAEKIEKFMTVNPVCVTHETQFIKVMAAMRLGKFRHLVVTDASGNLAGVISVKDVVDVMVDKFNEIVGR